MLRLLPVGVFAGTGLRIDVHNTGNPIPPDQLSHVFEPFRRDAPEGVKRSGLGLYIAKQIVESHGGKIAVSSTAEEGTSFVVELPRQPAPHPGSTGAIQAS